MDIELETSKPATICVIDDDASGLAKDPNCRSVNSAQPKLPPPICIDLKLPVVAVVSATRIAPPAIII